ncbi:MAG: ABC transporter ATP-binding protein [Rhodospirillaceae bacterium]|nr:ABC transporter ATP-binding protein [Rhodospirillaceae bacterium]
MSLLAVEGLNAWYDRSHVVQGVSFAVPEGGVTALLGRNGAGKTTTLKAIMGLVRRRSGSVRLAGQPVDGLPTHAVARAGVAYVPETRGVFPSLTVRENLAVAMRGAGAEGWTLERVYGLFPRLAERSESGGGTLSGGEQQMLVIARALLTNARLLILDEPTEGLAPTVIREIGACLATLKTEGLSTLLVEQNFAFATALADRVVVMGKGRVRWEGETERLSDDPAVMHGWLGL